MILKAALVEVVVRASHISDADSHISDARTPGVGLPSAWFWGSMLEILIAKYLL